MWEPDIFSYNISFRFYFVKDIALCLRLIKVFGLGLTLGIFLVFQIRQRSNYHHSICRRILNKLMNFNNFKYEPHKTIYAGNLSQKCAIFALGFSKSTTVECNPILQFQQNGYMIVRHWFPCLCVTWNPSWSNFVTGVSRWRKQMTMETI